MPLTKVYVDPSVGGPGSGTIGDPYASLQYALDNHARDTSNGNEFLITPGTPLVLSAPLDFSTWGSFTWSAPVSIRGNGGQAEIDCNGNSCTSHTATTPYGFCMSDVRVHNTGMNVMFDKAFRSSAFYKCEFDDCDADCFNVEVTEAHRFINCHFHNISGTAISGNKSGMLVEGCHFANDGSHEMDACISATAQIAAVSHCTFSIGGATTAILADSTGAYQLIFNNNSILSDGGSGYGIFIRRGIMACVYDNIIEGFSSGTGLEVLGSEAPVINVNSFYNNGTDFAGATNIAVHEVDLLASSGFSKSGADTYSNRSTYYSPNDVGNVLAGTFGYRGAVPAAAAAGGSTIFIPVED